MAVLSLFCKFSKAESSHSSSGSVKKINLQEVGDVSNEKLENYFKNEGC